MADPPLLAGGDQDSAASALPATAVTAPVSAPGVVDGVTAADSFDGVPAPVAFTPRTWKVYVVPLVRPVMVVLVVGTPPVVNGMVTERMTVPATLTSTENPVSEPTSDAFDQVSVAAALPAVALSRVGARAPTVETVWSRNLSCSTFHKVSVPSPVAGVTTGGVPGAPGVTTAGVLLLSVTDTEPFAFLTMVYCESGPL